MKKKKQKRFMINLPNRLKTRVQSLRKKFCVDTNVQAIEKAIEVGEKAGIKGGDLK